MNLKRENMGSQLMWRDPNINRALTLHIHCLLCVERWQNEITTDIPLYLWYASPNEYYLRASMFSSNFVEHYCANSWHTKVWSHPNSCVTTNWQIRLNPLLHLNCLELGVGDILSRFLPVISNWQCSVGKQNRSSKHCISTLFSTTARKRLPFCILRKSRGREYNPSPSDSHNPWLLWWMVIMTR